MIDILINVAIVAAIAVVGIIAVARTRPDTFHTARSATINA